MIHSPGHIPDKRLRKPQGSGKSPGLLSATRTLSAPWAHSTGKACSAHCILREPLRSWGDTKAAGPAWAHRPVQLSPLLEGRSSQQPGSLTSYPQRQSLCTATLPVPGSGQQPAPHRPGLTACADCHVANTPPNQGDFKQPRGWQQTSAIGKKCAT